MLKTQLRLEQRRAAQLERRVADLQASLQGYERDESVQSKLAACELALRNEKKRRSAAEQAAKVAKSEAFRIKRSMSEARVDTQDRVNSAQSQFADTTRRNNKLEVANSRLRKQVAELEREIQEQFEDSVAKQRVAEEAVKVAENECDSVRRVMQVQKQQLNDALRGNNAALGKERAAKTRLKAALSKSRLETQHAKKEAASATAKAKAHLDAKSTLQKQVKELQKKVKRLQRRVTTEQPDAAEFNGNGGGDIGIGSGGNGNGGSSEEVSPSSNINSNNFNGPSTTTTNKPVVITHDAHFERAMKEAAQEREKLVVLAQREQQIAKRLRDELKDTNDVVEQREKAVEQMRVCSACLSVVSVVSVCSICSVCR